MVIYRHKDKYSISEMCRFFVVSRSGYYGYVSRMDTPAWDLPLAEKIRECQDECGTTYGYRREHIWLERNGIYIFSAVVELRSPHATYANVCSVDKFLVVYHGEVITLLYAEEIYGPLVNILQLGRQRIRQAVAHNGTPQR